mgnify:CR=1 FL=1
MAKFNYPDWSTIHHKHWQTIIDENINVKEKLTAIEVGCFEGRSTLWFADTLLQHKDSSLHCIDSWEGGEEVVRANLGFDMDRVAANFIHNIQQHPRSDQISVWKTKSQKGLIDVCSLCYNEVDFIYLDGSHTQKDTLIDLVLALSLLKVGGIIIVDDYRNGMSTNNPLLRPKDAVDFVVKSYASDVSFFMTPEKQAVILRKN